MYYKAQYQPQEFEVLSLGQRKLSPYAHILYVKKGHILLRLGKEELFLTPGSCFYIPFDCLFQITALQGCHLDRVLLSPRLKSQTKIYPQGTGKLESPFLLEVLDKLSQSFSPIVNEKMKHLLDVVLDELASLRPITCKAPLKISPEIQSQLKCRQVIRCVKSGKKLDKLLNQDPSLKTLLAQYTDLI